MNRLAKQLSILIKTGLGLPNYRIRGTTIGIDGLLDIEMSDDQISTQTNSQRQEITISYSKCLSNYPRKYI
jgi:hypothetical protein